MLIAVVFGLTVALPPGAVRAGGDFPLTWLSWLTQRPAWSAWSAAKALDGLPVQQRGARESPTGQASAESTDAPGGAGRAPVPAPGTLPPYQPYQPPETLKTTGTSGFDAQRSRRLAARSDAKSDLFSNPDGSMTRRVYTSPVNFRAADGSWQPIDPTLEQRPDGRLHARANSLRVSVANPDAGTGARARNLAPSGTTDPSTSTVTGTELALLTLPTGETFGYGLDGAADVTPVVDGAVATYPEILPLTDVELQSMDTGLKETLVLKSPDAASSWVFPLHLNGLTPHLVETGSIELRNADDEAVAWIPRGFMEDSKVDPQSGAPLQGPVTYELITLDGGQPALRVTAAEAWLHDPARVYPVRVDPTAAIATNADVFVDDDSDTANTDGDNLAVGTYNGGGVKARSFLAFDQWGNDGLNGLRYTDAQLKLFLTWAYSCTEHRPFSVHRVTGNWQVIDLAYGGFPGPTLSPSAIGSLEVNDHYPACQNQAAHRNVGEWVTVPLESDVFSDWATGGLNRGLALVASETDSNAWKRFTSANPFSGALRPYLQLEVAANGPPQINGRYPDNNAVVSTLTPELLARGYDADAWPNKGLTYNFTVGDAATGATIAESGWTTAAWTVPAGKLAWNKRYLYTVQTFDKAGYSQVAPPYAFTTSVPQPQLTGNLAQNSGRGYDPSIGNYTTSATDAAISTVGPSLAVTRSYNSLDIRRTGAFGTGWSSVLDVRATQVKDVAGSVQTVLVTYPTGQDVAFGRNADGSFTAPSGRFSTLKETKNAGGTLTGYTLTDKDASVYTFGQAAGPGVFKVTGIADANGRQLSFTYDGAAQLLRMTSASGRYLQFTWATPAGSAYPHVSQVTTNPVIAGTPGSADTWTYGYGADDRLTSVCPPAAGSQCTTYQHDSTSQYANTALNVGPYSYWPLDEAPGASVAASRVLANAGVDNARYNNVTLGQPGGRPGSTATTAGFNGTSSYVQLPGNLIADGQYQSVSMWFRTTTTGGVLFSYNGAPVSNGTTGGNYTPALYIGSDGKLRGEFWQDFTTPITTDVAVNDGAWHHAVLSGAGDSQTLYLDGVAKGSLSGTINIAAPGGANHVSIGAGFMGGGWPNHPRTGLPAVATYFNGSIAGVSIFNQALTGSAVSALYTAGTRAHPVLSKVIRPSGGVTAEVAYDKVTGRVATVTDENGAVWTMGAPAVSGSSAVYAASVLGGKPTDYWRLGETDATDAVNEVQGGKAIYNGVTLNADGPFADSRAAAFDGASSHLRLPDDLPVGDNSIELWFSTTQAGGILRSSQASAIGQTLCPCRPTLWITSDGRLRGLAPASTPTGPLRAGQPGKCVDNDAASTADSNPIQLYTCNGSPAQNWSIYPDGTVRTSGKCLDLLGGATADLTRVVLFTCNVLPRQQWEPYNGGLRNVLSGKCLDNPANSTVNRTPLQILPCNGTPAQQWALSLGSSAPVNDGEWHHAVLTSNANSQALYLDGVLVAGSTGSAVLTRAAQQFAYAGAGATGTGLSGLTPNTTAYFDGRMAELAYYPSQLTAQQVAAHFEASKQTTPVAITLVSGVATTISMPVSTVAVTGPTGEKTSYSYDLVNGNRIVAQTDGLGNTTKFGYDVGGYSSLVYDPRGVWTQDLQDVRGNTKQKITCQDQTTNRCSSIYYTYFPDATSTNLSPDARNDLLLETRDGRSASATDNTYLTKFGYDAKGNQTTITDPLARVTATTYTDGTTTAAFGGGIAPAGLPTTVVTPGGAKQTVRYYSSGDVAEVIDPTGKITRFTYDGLGRRLTETEITDTYPAGLTTTNTYDQQGRRVTQTEPAVTNRVTGAVHTAKITTGYDPDGNILSETTADLTGGDASRTETHVFNGYGQETSVTNPVDETTSFQYDTYGNVVRETEPDGGVTTNAYDTAGNLLSTTVVGFTGDPNDPSPAQDLVIVTKQYDPAGRLATETDPMGWTTSYTYTDNGLAAKTIRSDGSKTFVVEENTYDAAGNVVRQVTNNGVTVNTSVYDAASRQISSTADPAGVNRTTTLTHDRDDNVVRTVESDPSGVLAHSDAIYDFGGRPVAETTYQTNLLVPVARWKLDDGSGTKAADAAGNSPGTASGGLTWSTERGGAAVLNGTNSGIKAQGPIVDTSRAYTVSAWAKPTTMTTEGFVVLMPGAIGSSAFKLSYVPATSVWNVSLSYRDVNGTNVFIGGSTPAGSVQMNAWSHLAVTVDPATSSVKLYVDGVVQATIALTKPLNNQPTVTNIGTDFASSWFKGSIDDVQAYQKALTPAEIAQVFAGTAPAADAGVIRSSVALDQDGNTKSSTDPNGNTTTFSIDEEGRTVKTTAPAAMAESATLGSALANAVSWVGYNTFGEQTDSKDPNGNWSVTGYDRAGRAISQRSPSYTAPGSSTPMVAETTTEYDDLGQVTRTTDPLGNSTEYEYDQLGRTSKVIAPNDGASTFTYDLIGDPLSQTDPSGAVSTSTYDYLGRQLTSTEVVRQDGTNYTTTYSYAPGGWLSQVKSPSQVTSTTTYNALGETLTVTDGANNVTGYSYDGVGRPTRTTMPDGTYRATTYDLAGRVTSNASYSAAGTMLTADYSFYDRAGNVVGAKDGRGTTTNFEYDATGMLTREVQPISGSDSIQTTFGYDLAGNRTRFTDGRGGAFLTTYNSWGLPESQIEPATTAHPSPADRTFTVTYDLAGRPVSQVMPGGVSVTSSYDEMGQVERQVGAGAEATAADRVFDYDMSGRMTSFSGPGGANTLTYDDRDMPRTITGPVGNSTFGYNPDGQLASRVDAAGSTSYGYDGAGRLASVANPTAGVQLTTMYNTLSQVSKITYGGTGNTRNFSYDGLHRQLADELKTPGGTLIARVAYGWDGNDNIVSKSSSGFGPSVSNTYSYDLADRLTSWNNGTATTVYAYDKAGNRVQNGSKLFTYDQRNRLLTADGAGYAYTARGTLASVGGVTTATDAFGQVRSQGSASGARTYDYDALGRAVQSGFAYAGLGNDLASDGTTTYTRDPSGGLLGTASGGTQRLSWTDLHTDVIGQFTATGTALTGSSTYDPLGKVLAQAGLIGGLGYQSEWTDTATGRVNMHARWYNTDTGQFDTRDTASNSPVPDSITANRYQYGDANPLTMTDPTGYWPNPLKAIGKKVSSAAKAVTSAVSYVYTAAKTVATVVVKAAVSVAKKVVSVAKKVVTVAKKVTKKVVKAVKKKVEQGRKYVAKKVDQAKKAVKKTVSVVKQAGKQIIAKAARPLVVAATALKDSFSAVSKWAAANKDTLLEFAAIGGAILAGMACTAVTAGVGAVACMVGAGALINLAKDAAQGDIHSMGDALGSLGTGALSGLAGGAGGLLAGKAAAAVGSRLGSGLLGRLATEATENGVDEVLNQAFTTGRIDPKSALAGMVPGLSLLNRKGGGGVPSGSGKSSGPAGAGCVPKHSFDPATPVLMADGSTRPIEDVNVGDRVVATDPETGVSLAKPVTQLHRNTDKQLTDVTVTRVEDKKSPSKLGVKVAAAVAGLAAAVVLQTTAYHPFWDETTDTWANASELTVGHELRTADGDKVVVAKVDNHTGLKEMRDLTVADIHTYYVAAGVESVLAHNVGGERRGDGASCGGGGGGEWADPNDINFSQRTASPNSYADQMRSGEWDWNRPGTPLRVMDVDGQLVSYDNRRLDAGREVGAPVRIERVNPGDPFPDSTTGKTWGDKFRERFNDPRNKRAGGVVPPQGLYDRPDTTGRR
ncbi:ricin-type beta-trefoil lectin domain protein [Micromonospora sp. NBC_01699]|uniref:LamG-like jellyroll fold domain-containing protein n=1 Tax=Micromonospora sp. NBC_01699 TaxID=2975984 RepID=UPI002E2C7C48|nr:LamG-like jellyroll fold domain-containing protein [Micromonospora sp. NBC_01699]